MKNDVLENLNRTQTEAVLYFDSPLLIIAGAGSGKTSVIAHKIAYLIKEKDYPPNNILGVTFTNRAADEMRNRIESLTGINAGNFNISTFHSFGLRILREAGHISGYDAAWQIIDDIDQKKVIERLIKENFEYFTNDMLEDVRKKISLAKMNLYYPNNPDFLLQKGFNSDEVKIFSLYYDYQKRSKVWDYEDLVSLPVKLLQNYEDLREKYAGRFRYVLVDEFQDTNPNQYELIKEIAGKHNNITVVGDDDQAIYSWRGASMRFLFNFEHDFPRTRIIKLEQNYRSTRQILDFANDVIAGNTFRRKKSMWSEKKEGAPVFIL
ncbi:MAG: ATP-dependent helicase, partial [Candidatus Aminicenantes bacterium]|nr:ATP-dependent helicase [Candidatus Aminicenantes bacterium]